MRNSQIKKKKKNSDKEGEKNSLFYVVVLKESKRRGKKNYVCLVSFFVFVFVDIPSMGNRKKSITLTKVYGPKNQA